MTMRIKDIELTGERFIPEKSSIKLQDDHMERYKFATGFVEDKRVLDIACGVGYGSVMLLNSGASSVDAVDISSEAIRYALQNHISDGIKYIQSDIIHYKSEEKYNLIVSFETIEHVPDYRGALKNLADLLSSNGKLIISSPNRLITSPRCKSLNDKPKNKFHTQEFTVSELKNELESVGLAVNEVVYGQRQQRYFSNRLLKNIYKEIFKPGKKFSAKVTPIENKAPQFFVLIAEKLKTISSD